MAKVIKAADVNKIATANFSDRVAALEKEVKRIGNLLKKLQKGIAEAGSKVPLQSVFTIEDAQIVEVKEEE